MIACGTCGTERNIVRHHDDYSKADDTRPLCRTCHAFWHASNGCGANSHLVKTVNVAVERDLHRTLKEQGGKRDLGVQKFVDRVLRAALRRLGIDMGEES